MKLVLVVAIMFYACTCLAGWRYGAGRVEQCARCERRAMPHLSGLGRGRVTPGIDKKPTIQLAGKSS